MQEILEHFKSNGFEPGELILDGVTHRFELDRKDHKKSGWYCGFQNFTRNTGQLYHVVVYGSWRTGEEFTFKSNVEMSPEDRKSVKEAIDKAQRKAQEARRAEQEKVAVECLQKWEGLSPDEVPDYFKRKNLRQMYGCRAQASFEGISAYVPMMDIEGKLWSLQKIQPDGGKFFSPGSRVQGCFHQIGELSDPIYIAEGLATAASIHEATEVGVIVAFNSSNLVAVAKEFRRLYPDTGIIICADEDLWTKKPDGTPWNPGREKAEEAATAVLGKAIFPKFKKTVEGMTDFNDLECAEGLEVVREQVLGVKVEKAAITPLGFRGNSYFFTSSSNQQIVEVSAFTETNLLNLIRKEYWEASFPGAKSGIDWLTAKSRMMDACRRKGIFEPRRIRGSGVWSDNGRLVVNMGDRLLVDGEEMAVNEIKSRFFYTLGRRLPEVTEEPLTVEECELLTSIAENFKWIRAENGILLAGFLVIAKICGALPIHPHVWVTGGSSTGKSTLLQRLVKPTLSDYCLYFQGGTTEAGVRQSLGADCVPIIFDEFETNGTKSKEFIAACVELMRSAWSETDGYIAKGSSSGSAMFYQPRFSAIVSSIRTNLDNDADRSRFAILELAPHGNDQEHWKTLLGLLTKYDDLYVRRLFARSIRMVNTLLDNYKRLRIALTEKTNTRYGDQYGMLLAGYSVLISDEPLSGEEVDGLVERLVQGVDDTNEADEVECLNAILTRKVRVNLTMGDYEEITIGAAVAHAGHEPRFNEGLQSYGLLAKNGFLHVATTHSELKSLLSKTRWENCWGRVLSRLSGAKSGKNNPTIRIGGRVMRCVSIPLDSIL